ncbi:MAG: PIG-L family deacetylase [Bacteroidota bacterium]
MSTLKTCLFSIGIFLLATCSSKPTVEQLKKFAATESYPKDQFLDKLSQKRALIIVAHDDDDCAMSGTIAQLTQKGWTIKQLSLVSHNNPKTGQNAAPIICQGNELILEDGQYRIGQDTMKAQYLPIPREEIKKQFRTQKVAQALIEKVNDFQPSVIFTLDNEKGGYGHPDHIFISQLVVDLFKSGKLNAQRIYQSVFTDHMEKEIVDTRLKAKMKKWGFPDASSMANALYGIDGMPEPDVQISIRKQAKIKMAYLRAYPKKVKKNLRKFIPYYEDFEAEVYFSIFDRECFRVLAK